MDAVLPQPDLIERLFGAVKSADLSGVKSALADGANPGFKDWTQTTALHMSVKLDDHPEIVAAIADAVNVKMRSDVVDACDLTGATPLVRAAALNRLGAAKVLLAQGADPNIIPMSTFHALYGAAANGHVKMCNLLLDHGAKIEQESDRGLRPLHGACKGGHWDCAESLIERGADVLALDVGQESPIQVAMRAGLIPFRRVFERSGLGVSVTLPRIGSLLHLAIREKAIDVFSYLLDAGANAEFVLELGKDDETEGVSLSPLFYAIMMTGRAAMVARLLEHGVDLDALNEHTPESWAEAQGNEECAAILRAHRARQRLSGALQPAP